MTVALNSAVSGLIAAQQALDAASRNIANASTPGYTRKVLQQENFLIAGKGVGVHTLGLTRSVNVALIAAVNKQLSVSESYTIRQKYLDRIVDFHGASQTGQALSSKMTALGDALTDLSSSPSDLLKLNQVIQNASRISQKINDFSNMINDMRIQSESDIKSAVNEINTALKNIAVLNGAITSAKDADISSADLEDERDNAIKTVAKYLDVSTYSIGRGSVALIGKSGQVLADDTAHLLYFSTSNLLPTSYYGGAGTLSGLHLESASGLDLLTQGALGGQLGTLFDMRDNVLPQYAAQMDEFAMRMAERFENEGLRLFSDLGGNLPADVPTSAPPLGYLGFSSQISVNTAIVANPYLLRDGTKGNTEQAGSNEVIRRVAQFAFSPYEYQQATSTAVIGGIGDLITNLPLVTSNIVTGNVNIATFAPDLSSAIALPSGFTLSINGVPQEISINPGDDASDLVTTINGLFPGVASLDSQGQLRITSTSSVAFADGSGAPNPALGAAGMAALGFSFGVTNPPNPTFQVQVGNRTPVTITIAPGDTSVQLLVKLNAVTGLTAVLNGGNQLVLTPTDGGDLKITDGLGTPLNVMGMTVANVAHTAFSQNNLGPGGDLGTDLLGNSTLQDYIASIISAHGEAHNLNQTQQEQEAAFYETLDTRNKNYSGVNIDQEMADLIRLQTAYSAAAKMISASQKMFDELLNTFRV